MLNDLLNRTQAVVHRSDVWAALALAKEWQQQGRAQWFRGQVFPWPPRSSLLRWTNRANSGDTLSTEPTLYRFYDWAQQRPELSFIAAEISKLTAVAQHFGLPTNYVDFSVSPEVAALFSRDQAPDSIYPSEEACIYCLNLDDMRNWFLSLDRAEAAEAQVYPESLDLPSLHRLTAQKGVFLHAPGSWDERFKPLCILFPRGPGFGLGGAAPGLSTDIETGGRRSGFPSGRQHLRMGNMDRSITSRFCNPASRTGARGSRFLFCKWASRPCPRLA
jgi:hypothetical protein